MGLPYFVTNSSWNYHGLWHLVPIASAPVFNHCKLEGRAFCIVSDQTLVFNNPEPMRTGLVPAEDTDRHFK